MFYIKLFGMLTVNILFTFSVLTVMNDPKSVITVVCTCSSIQDDGKLSQHE